MLFIVLAILLAMLSACDKDETPAETLSTAEALNNYWQYQTDLTSAMEARDAVMAEMQQAIADLENTNKGKDTFSELETLYENYASQCDAISEKFDAMARAENAIIPYGGNKGLLSSLAKGIYNKAADTVVSSGRMVRSGFRVLTGRQTIRQVVNDPNSGIPLLSGWADTIQKRNTARDAKITEMIRNWNPTTSPVDCNNTIPYDDLPGSTPQEKASAYLNLPDEDPVKMETRSLVLTWDHDENLATANAAEELGETGVKAVGDAYGGGVGEWTNEVLNQHMQEGQTSQNAGTLNVNVNSASSGNPPITTGRTLVISKANMPDEDPRITVIMNAPQNLEQQLPAGQYNVIALADGFIRSVYENLRIVQGQTNQIATQLLKLSENAIIIEDLTVDEGCITKNEPVHAHVTCVSTIGKALSFDWTVTGGTYSNLTQDGTDLTFTPTEEKEYTISVNITDDANNSKTRSISVASLGGSLVIDDWQITSEGYTDSKLNPGENATVTLFVSNTGTTDIVGSHGVVAGEGFTTSFSSGSTSIPAGQTLAVPVPITINKELGEAELSLQYLFTTTNANNDTAIISDEITMPVDFYVTINPFEDVVTERIITISGVVANPQLTTAVLILDNDIEHAVDLNVSNCHFSQQIVLAGSAQEVQHTVRVVAVAGALAAENSMTFSSQVPLMALLCTLTWNTGGTDVDFWITDPNGERCWYQNHTTGSGLTLDVDDTNGYGPENITSPAVIPGDYLVQVQYYSDHDDENAIGSDCTVVIQEGEGTPVNYYGYLADSGDLWNVTTLHYDAAKGWSVKPLNTYSHVDSRSLPAKSGSHARK